ncbi:chagasin family peptidase inhibitor I42 [Gregarina niphandrodes]|uniref:Chagasin family peptidase inhibitor I42 n=1 Tax=Gregarina niphandrodes TaxID=110365 RepID=A0A023B887_GRENI|nr:chagasin family peptidase inhibitor I42 [Gregarina niphandrodes]EZG68342.1 chagasin family peptidase inhibitor I42 [Gregarina niphandrodes]|eukprot:XP_011134585.1 chagasin family peptidase inhibitor I42 [Gregarina niphandrodes]
MKLTSDSVNDVAVNGSGIVELDSNATTGYCWMVKGYKKVGVGKFEKGTEASDSWSIKNSEYTKPTNNMPGAPGKESFEFVFHEPGEHEIVMLYARPWEANQPGKTVTYKVKVT